MKQYTKEGREYKFCWCGLVAYDGLKRCDRHLNKDKPKRQSQGHYSGYSKHQSQVDGFMQSGHS